MTAPTPDPARDAMAGIGLLLLGAGWLLTVFVLWSWAESPQWSARNWVALAVAVGPLIAAGAALLWAAHRRAP